MKVRVCIATVAAACVFAVATPTSAIITHPADDGQSALVPRPPEGVVGRWGSNASAVAVAPDYILTTRHQGGGVGTPVVFGGVTYVAAEAFPAGAADLRVVRITTAAGAPANLPVFTPVYMGTDDAGPLATTLAGFGRGRGTELTTAGGTYGYGWLAEGNGTLRYGRNRIESSDTDADELGFVTEVLVADFDARSDPSAVPFEAALSEFDSGGGWFVQDGLGQWRVAGLNRATGHSLANIAEPPDRSLFASSLDAAVASPDVLEAVRLRPYSGFIDSIITPVPEPAAAIAMAGLLVLVSHRRRRHPGQGRRRYVAGPRPTGLVAKHQTW